MVGTKPTLFPSLNAFSLQSLKSASVVNIGMSEFGSAGTLGDLPIGRERLAVMGLALSVSTQFEDWNTFETYRVPFPLIVDFTF
jgi:hypothetical protein